MNTAVIVAIVDMFLGLLEIFSYALLVYWAAQLVRSFPLEKYFKKIRFYHILIPALALAGFAYQPMSVIWKLIRKFPLDYSKAWIPSLLKFFEGLGFLGVLVWVSLRSESGSGEGFSRPPIPQNQALKQVSEPGSFPWRLNSPKTKKTPSRARSGFGYAF